MLETNTKQLLVPQTDGRTGIANHFMSLLTTCTNTYGNK